MEDMGYADVTMACEDGQQGEAHKVVIAVFCSFFQNVNENKNQHPLIYMRLIKSENLFAIVDFMYLVEANIYNTNLQFPCQSWGTQNKLSHWRGVEK